MQYRCLLPYQEMGKLTEMLFSFHHCFKSLAKLDRKQLVKTVSAHHSEGIRVRIRVGRIRVKFSSNIRNGGPTEWQTGIVKMQQHSPF